MTATSGQKCFDLCKSGGPLGSLVKTLLVTSRWGSTKCFLTWRVSATPAGRLLFRLVPSMPRTEETEFGLWPTPSATDYKGGRKSHEWRRPNNNYRDFCRQILGQKIPCPKKTEWLMGYPTGWTDLEHLETPSCRKWRLKSSKRWVNKQRACANRPGKEIVCPNNRIKKSPM